MHLDVVDITVCVRCLQSFEFHQWFSVYKRGVRTEDGTPFAHVPTDIENVPPSEAAKWFPDSLVIGCFRGTELIGIARVDRRSPVMLAHKAGLTSVYIVPEYRGRGCGQILLEGVIREALHNDIERLRLYVDVGNVNAVRAYKAAGFKICGWEECAKKINGVYVDQLIMECGIPPDFVPSLREFTPKDNSGAINQAVRDAQRSALSPVGVP
jgi:ribosomal protein S18 acetylase RimI-like enzyme